MQKDRITGCLVGGAVGDALGYEVEFFRLAFIQKMYGTDGIIDLNMKRKYKMAAISDDTQMTLFTSEGLIAAKTAKGADTMQKDELSETYLSYIWDAYRNWYRTQDDTFDKEQETDSWLLTIPEMFQRQAPGNTCLSALAKMQYDLSFPVNNSKGCGGVMRSAPIGLFFDPKKGKERIYEIAMLGADAAKLTHGHSLGYIPSAAFVYLINQIIYPDSYEELNDVDKTVGLKSKVLRMIDYIGKIFEEDPYIETFTSLIKRAVALAEANEEDHSAIRQLGEGWVAEETLAIAIYCSLRYQNDFRKALQCAVNHDGDSDSTGSVCGNILGAYHGLQKIKNSFDLNQLELCDVIITMAEKLYEASV